MFGAVLRFLTGGALDRVLRTVDKNIEAKTDKERVKADIIKANYAQRASWMAAGGFWLMVVAGAPFVYHAGAVAIYSVHWCQDCHAPKPWTIAKLPEPFDEYQGWIYIALFGAIGVTQIRRR